MPACVSRQLGDCWRCYNVYAADHLFNVVFLFNSVKLCYSACLQHLIGLIKSRMANSWAGERREGVALRDDKHKERRT